MSHEFKKPCILKSQKGTSVVFFAIVLTVITAFAAISIDIGVMVLEKTRLSNAMDSAALAGAQEMVADSSNVEDVVKNYISKNVSAIKEESVSISPDQRQIEVKGVKTVQNYFAGIFGKKAQDINAISRARVENIKSLGGTRPIAVVQQNFVYGTLYTLKEGGGGGTSGNYACISLGGTGGSVYRNNLLYGYSGTITVGDLIETETGNIAGSTQTSINQLIRQCSHTPPCTYLSYNVNCPRIIFIPVVNTLQVNGRKYVKVLGFATFFLEGVTDRNGQADVIGRFITYVAHGEMSSDINDYGTYGIRLVK